MPKNCWYCDRPLTGELALTNKGIIHRKCLYLSRGGDRKIVDILFNDDDTRPIAPQHPPVPDPEPEVFPNASHQCPDGIHSYDRFGYCTKCGFARAWEL